MSAIEIRPRFQEVLPASPEVILERLQKRLEQATDGVYGYVADHHVVLKVPQEAQHFWSPQLALEVEEHEDGALVRGLYGPNPTVWLMFIFFYAIIGFACTIILIMGLSEWNLGLPGRILWLLPVALFIFAMVWLSARAGQRLGREQMHLLHDFFEEIARQDLPTKTKHEGTV